ncbi:MAG TPA: hypothetical protein VKW04_15390 [Planctomycetota bacterium]|nr:hypothetical protein [Planctomycetota bacterium]
MRAFWACVSLLWGSTATLRPTQENPEYKAWSPFPTGAWVRHRQVEDSAGLLMEWEITTRLLDCTPEKAVLGIETVRIVYGSRSEFHRDRREIPACVARDRDPDRADDRDLREGEEVVKVGHEDLPCRWVEVCEMTRSGKSISKTWSCPRIPGEIVNMESRLESSAPVRRTTTLQAWSQE